MTEASIRRHAKHHLPATLKRAAQAAEVVRGADLLVEVRSLHEKTLGILNGAEAADDKATVLKAVRESRENLTLLARLLGQLGGGAQATATVNITTPEDLQRQVLELFAAEVRTMPPELRDQVIAWLRARRRAIIQAEVEQVRQQIDAQEPPRYSTGASPNGQRSLLPGGAEPVDRVDGDDARTQVRALAERFAWPTLALLPGLVIAQETGWRDFAAGATETDVAEALRALRAVADGGRL